jgi:hypothetical protein
MATTRRTRQTAAAAATEASVAPDTATVDPTPTEAPTSATPDSDTAPDTEAATDTDTTPAEAPVSAVPVSAVPVSGAPTSGAPATSADYMKIVMVAGVLGDHPDGVSAATVVDESGLRAAIVGRVLGAMEVAGVALRKPPAEGDEAGVELWLRGEADLSAVDLSVAAVREVCPTCQRPMPRAGVNTRRSVSTAPGMNGDGKPTLGKGQLEAMVRDFLHAHPGHEFNAGTISRELGRSSGAVSNALAKLVINGAAVLTNEAPMRYTAPADKATADTVAAK